MTHRITNRCPSCGNQTLFVSDDGGLCCSWLPCAQPVVGETIAALQRENAKLTAVILAAEWEGSDACAMPACPFCGADRPSNWPEVGDYEPHDADCPVRRIKTALTPSAAPGMAELRQDLADAKAEPEDPRPWREQLAEASAAPGEGA